MSLEKRERCGGECGSIIAVHLATHALIPTYPLICTEHAGEREKKPVTISEWILMSPHFHQRLCLTAVNNHFEDSQSPQASSTEPPRPAMCSGRVNHEDTNAEVFVRGGRLKESRRTPRLGATWLQATWLL